MPVIMILSTNYTMGFLEWRRKGYLRSDAYRRELYM